MKKKPAAKRALDIESNAASDAMKIAAGTSLIGRNIRVDGHRTSVRLEPAMWNAFHEIGRREDRSIDDLASDIARIKKDETSLTAAIRVFIMAYFKEAATEDGHKAAGHGLDQGQKPLGADTALLAAALLALC